MKRFVVVAMMTGAAMWAQGQAQQAKPQKVDAAAAAKAELEKQQAEAKAAAAKAAEEKPTAGAPNVSVLAVPPDTLVATADGQKITAGMIQEYLAPMSPQLKQQALSRLRDFVANLSVMNKLAQVAEQDKLDQKEPWKRMLDNARLQVLSQAAVDRQVESIQITPADIQKVYDSNQDGFTQAKVKGIHIGFSSAPVSTADNKGKRVLSEDEAKAKIEDLLKQARSGADFGKLAKENSDDPTSAEKNGDFGAIPKAAENVPKAIRDAIFGAKAGEITEPVRQPGGFYIFRVEEIGKKPLDEVKQSIENDLKNARLQEWFSGLQKNLNVKMEGQFSEPPSPAPSPKPAAPAK